MAFLSGNIGNLRIPSAAAALKATNTKLGTDEGSIISTIGVAASVFVNIILLVIGVFIGSQVLSHLPSVVVDSLLCYQASWFNWIPLDPYIANILLAIFGTEKLSSEKFFDDSFFVAYFGVKMPDITMRILRCFASILWFIEGVASRALSKRVHATHHLL